MVAASLYSDRVGYPPPKIPDDRGYVPPTNLHQPVAGAYGTLLLSCAPVSVIALLLGFAAAFFGAATRVLPE